MTDTNNQEEETAPEETQDEQEPQRASWKDGVLKIWNTFCILVCVALVLLFICGGYYIYQGIVCLSESKQGASHSHVHHTYGGEGKEAMDSGKEIKTPHVVDRELNGSMWWIYASPIQNLKHPNLYNLRYPGVSWHACKSRGWARQHERTIWPHVRGEMMKTNPIQYMANEESCDPSLRSGRKR